MPTAAPDPTAQAKLDAIHGRMAEMIDALRLLANDKAHPFNDAAESLFGYEAAMGLDYAVNGIRHAVAALNINLRTAAKTAGLDYPCHANNPFTPVTAPAPVGCTKRCGASWLPPWDLCPAGAAERDREMSRDADSDVRPIPAETFAGVSNDPMRISADLVARGW